VARKTDYGSIAPTFDRRYRVHDYSGVEAALGMFLAAEMRLDVLDCGCGTGHWLHRLASPDRHLVGLDASAEMLTQAVHGRQLELVQAQAEYLPFEADSFDRVFCVNSLHHFAPKPLFVSEVRRVLRRRGGFTTIGLDPHTGLDRWWIYDYFANTLDLDKQRYLPAKTIRELLSTVGFVDCRTEIVQRFPVAASARNILDHGGLAKTATSQLAILTDDEYQRGVQQIQADLITAERSSQELFLLSDLRLYATTAWLK
jgi:ubiquinone/menaquinone biosynthesis C-methylase UbiE